MEEILKPGRNCWRAGSVDKAAFLVDSAAYFSAFVEGVRAASSSILIVGWDIDSRLRLVRDGGHGPGPVELKELLEWAVRRRPELHVHILVWDFAVFYASERELAPVFELGWKTHPRIRFQLDDRLPTGGCQHQKLVVIDDTVAFIGGMDLTRGRWDTPEHLPEDPRRVDPDGETYPPVHDVHLAVQGPVAADLGGLVRERWQEVTGTAIAAAGGSNEAAWPSSLDVDIEDARAGVSRTLVSYDGGEDVREIERLYLDAVDGARECVYIESQYLTSEALNSLLAERLREEDGPEIVVVLPRENHGWLEEQIMGALRTKWIEQLREADRFQRFGVYYPVTSEEAPIGVHSKVLVVDDGLVRIGSSNACNRSLGLDAECDLTLEAEGDASTCRAIAGLRDRLLAEHLDRSPEEVESSVARHSSVLRAIEALRGEGRSLRPFNDAASTSLDDAMSQIRAVDPEKPMAPDRLAALLMPTAERAPRWWGWQTLRFLVPAGILLALFILWKIGGLQGWLGPDELQGVASRLRASPATPVLVVGGFVVGSLLMVPITLMIAATALAFEPLPAAIYSLVGCLAAASLTFWLGVKLGRDVVRNYAGRRINRWSLKLAREGFLAMTAVRIVPVGPFTLINLAAGATGISFTDYLLGNLVGLVPGVLMLTLAADALVAVATAPTLGNVALLLAAVVGFLGIVWGLRKLLDRWTDDDAGDAPRTTLSPSDAH